MPAIDALEERLGKGRIERDVPLAQYTTFRIGGSADLFFRARSPDELPDIGQWDPSPEEATALRERLLRAGEARGEAAAAR